MKKTILIPIDFRVASLNTLKLALEANHENQIRVVLLYAEYLSDSISELLGYSWTKSVRPRLTPEFKEALEILKNRFVRVLVGEIQIAAFHGLGTSVFNQLIEKYQVDEGYIPLNYAFYLPGRAFDPRPIIKKSKLPLHEIEWELQPHLTEKEQLLSLFN